MRVRENGEMKKDEEDETEEIVRVFPGRQHCHVGEQKGLVSQMHTHTHISHVKKKQQQKNHTQRHTVQVSTV